MKPYLQLDSLIDSLEHTFLVVQRLQVGHVQFPETAVHSLPRGLGDGGRAAVPPLKVPVQVSLPKTSFQPGLCRFRFQKNRNSDSLTVYGLFSGIDSVIVGQKNRKMNQKGIVF